MGNVEDCIGVCAQMRENYTVVGFGVVSSGDNRASCLVNKSLSCSSPDPTMGMTYPCGDPCEEFSRILLFLGGVPPFGL
jgi:hypothetical protein